jgi:aryl-alcohol dehydrogenase (NADP+)
MNLSRAVPQTDLRVFPLCLGGNVFGSTVTGRDAFDVLDAYRAAGGNMIDTADSYCHWVGSSGGESETLIGEWLRARGNRDEMVIATKVGQAPGRENLRPETIRAAVEGSLRRLQVDYIDVYYAHQDHGDRLEPTLEALDDLVQREVVRHVAASNYGADRLRAALDVSARAGRPGYVAYQPLYNLMDRADYETDIAPLAADAGIGVFPYWGLACGYLTGKYRLAGPDVVSARAAFVAPYRTDRGERVLAALREVADARGVHCGAVALAWLAARPGVVAPLASARTAHQLEDLLPMTELRLAADEAELLDTVSAPHAVTGSAS